MISVRSTLNTLTLNRVSVGFKVWRFRVSGLLEGSLDLVHLLSKRGYGGCYKGYWG